MHPVSMVWQPTPYTVPLLVAALASFSFAVYAVRNRSRERYRSYGASLVSRSVAGSGRWRTRRASSLSATTLEATLLWNRLVWVGVAALTVAWPVFVFVYVDWTAWIRPRRIALLCLVPATAVGGIFVVGADPIFTRLRRCPIRTGSS